ncbi:MAG: methyl-accepting chemotaxis protein [Chloroflexota bacterium]|nr:methyl-accepting chemotaxis protein [Chloroflexota bacterium]
MNAQTKTPSYQQKLGWRRLSVTMGLRMVLTALTPLIIIALVIATSLSRSIRDLTLSMHAVRQEMTQNVAGENLQGQAKVTMDVIDAYMRERLQDMIEWANAPIVRQAAREGAVRARRLGLTSLSKTQIEDRMDDTRALSDDAELTQYLIGLSERNPAFAEIFFTEEHGFNVAYSTKPSNFVQAGEACWDTAWEKGGYIGGVKYDDLTGVHSIDFCVRIENTGGNPIGVLKAALDVQVLQDMVADASSRVTDGEAHLFTEQAGQTTDLSQYREKSGYLLHQQNQDGEPIAVGYASSAPGSYYGVQGFDGFDWLITVEQLEGAAFASLQGLDSEIPQMEEARASILNLILVVGIATAAGAFIVALFAARNIVRPIEQLAQASQRIATGDFSTQLQVKQRNEISQLQNTFLQMATQLRQTLEDERKQREHLQAVVAEYMNFVADVALGNLTMRLTLDGNGQQDDPLIALGYNLNGMVDNLRNMAEREKEVVQNLGSAAAEILAATTQQASGASEQSAAIAQTTTTVDELKTIAEQSVYRAQEVANASQRTVDVSQTGKQAVLDTIESMTQIKSRVEGIAENILTLSEQTQQIGEIIATVSDIAAQSNMLALNASVEAARAGEYGKGFAVVAVEVRNLAEQSRQATAQVKAILSDIQKATNATVMATEEGTKGVDEGVQLAAQAREAIEQLGMVIEESTQTATQMVAGGRQQASGVEQIALAMQNINQATTQNLSSTRQTEKAAKELNDLSSRLSETVEQYRL